jgi:hypothetical protein
MKGTVNDRSNPGTNNPPTDSFQVIIEPDRVDRSSGRQESFYFSSLPPWWKMKKETGESSPRPDASGDAEAKSDPAGDPR